MIVLLLVIQKNFNFVFSFLVCRFFLCFIAVQSRTNNSVREQNNIIYNFVLFFTRLTIYIFILDKTMSEKNLTDENVDSEEEDDDYCPTKHDNEQSDSSHESEHDADNQAEDEKPAILNVAPYDESKTNELWKNFASSTKATPPPPPTTTTTVDPKPINKIFDYAGEKVSVPVPPTNPSLKRPAAAASSTTSNSVLDRLGIGKKQKLSTLEKSRLDWSAHKESELLTEDLDSHRRGKDSYVEKKAFLQRSELREHDHFLTSVKKK